MVGFKDKDPTTCSSSSEPIRDEVNVTSGTHVETTLLREQTLTSSFHQAEAQT